MDDHFDRIGWIHTALQSHMPRRVTLERISRGEESRLLLIVPDDFKGGAREALAQTRRKLLELDLPIDVKIETRTVGEE